MFAVFLHSITFLQRKSDSARLTYESDDGTAECFNRKKNREYEKQSSFHS